jgi:predicted ATPase
MANIGRQFFSSLQSSNRAYQVIPVAFIVMTATISWTANSFFGREKELLFLTECLNAVIAGQGSVILIGGEAGVGKTSLAQSFFSKICKEAVVARGYCLAEISIPYFAFSEALEALFHGKKDERGLISWLSGSGAGSRLASRDQMFELIVRKLNEESLKKPLILFLDDLHWADSASLALLHYLARNTKDRKILIIGT